MNLQDYRQEIDKLDSELTALFEKRLALSGKIAEFKSQNNIPVFDANREQEKLEAVKKAVLDNGGTEEDAILTTELFAKIMELSKKRQNELINK